MPVLVPPPYTVTAKALQAWVNLSLLARLRLRLIRFYRKGGPISKGTYGKIILGLAGIVFGLELFFSLWTKDARKTTAEFYHELDKSLLDLLTSQIEYAEKFADEWGELLHPGKGRVPKVERRVVVVENDIADKVFPRIQGVNSEIDRLRNYLLAPGAVVPPGEYHVITRIRERIADVRTELLGYLSNLNDAVVAVSGRVTALREDTVTWVGNLDAHIVDVRGELRRGFAQVTAQLEPVRDYVLPLAAAIPLAVMIPAIGTLVTNRPKLEAQCRLDLDDFEQLFDMLLVLFGLGTILTVLELTADSSQEIMESIHETFY